MIQYKIILIYFLVIFIILPNQLHLHIPSQYYKVIPSLTLLTSFYYQFSSSLSPTYTDYPFYSISMTFFFLYYFLAFKFLEPKTTIYILFIVSSSALFSGERERERGKIVQARIWTKIQFKSSYLYMYRVIHTIHIYLSMIHEYSQCTPMIQYFFFF